MNIITWLIVGGLIGLLIWSTTGAETISQSEFDIGGMFVSLVGAIIQARPQSVQAAYTRRVTTMRTNLLAVAQDALGGSFAKLAGSLLRESPTAVQSAVSSLLPVIIAGVVQKGASPQGASNLLFLMDDDNLDTKSLDNIAGIFSGSGAGVNGLLKQGTNRFVPALFGDRSGALASVLSSASGIKISSATSLLAMLVPLVLALLKKYIGSSQRNADPLASLLSVQGSYLQAALDSRLTKALGFSSSAAFVRGLGGAQ